jgi:hypothetical protein
MRALRLVPSLVLSLLVVTGVPGFLRADDWSPLWTTANLSQARFLLAATTVDGKVLFAGGQSGGSWSNVVDVFDSATNSWSVGHVGPIEKLPSNASPTWGR